MKTLAYLLLGMMLSVSLLAQPKVLTLAQAVEIALERNFSIIQSQNNLERDQAGVLSAYGNFMPSVSLNSTWSGGEQFFNGAPIGGGGRRLNSSLSASMTLFDGFTNTSSFSQASATAVSSEYTLSRTRQTVVNQVQRLYYEVLRMEKLLEIAGLNLQYNAQQLDRVKETARLGSASLVNVYQQQAQVGTDEVRVAQAQSDYDIAQVNLVAYLALDVMDQYVIRDPSIPSEIDANETLRLKESTGDFRALSDMAFERRLDYQSAKESYRATQAGVTIARSGYFPRISVNGSYALSGGSGTNPLDGTKVTEFNTFGDARSTSWSMSLSLPIFSGFRTNEGSERAQVAQKNAEEGLRNNERQILIEIRSALLLLNSAEKNYDAAVKSLQFQDQNLKVNQEKYNVGAGTLLDLLFAQNNYNSALTTKINAVYQYLNAKSNLEYALGTIQQ